MKFIRNKSFIFILFSILLVFICTVAYKNNLIRFDLLQSKFEKNLTLLVPPDFELNPWSYRDFQYASELPIFSHLNQVLSLENKKDSWQSLKEIDLSTKKSVSFLFKEESYLANLFVNQSNLALQRGLKIKRSAKELVPEVGPMRFLKSYPQAVESLNISEDIHFDSSKQKVIFDTYVDQNQFFKLWADWLKTSIAWVPAPRVAESFAEQRALVDYDSNGPYKIISKSVSGLSFKSQVDDVGFKYVDIVKKSADQHSKLSNYVAELIWSDSESLSDKRLAFIHFSLTTVLMFNSKLPIIQKKEVRQNILWRIQSAQKQLKIKSRISFDLASETHLYSNISNKKLDQIKLRLAMPPIWSGYEMQYLSELKDILQKDFALDLSFATIGRTLPNASNDLFELQMARLPVNWSPGISAFAKFACSDQAIWSDPENKFCSNIYKTKDMSLKEAKVTVNHLLFEQATIYPLFSTQAALVMTDDLELNPNRLTNWINFLANIQPKKNE